VANQVAYFEFTFQCNFSSSPSITIYSSLPSETVYSTALAVEQRRFSHFKLTFHYLFPYFRPGPD
jgi:hypothetical protein